MMRLFAFQNTLTFLLITLSINVLSQISGTGCLGETQYTDGNPNDPIYYYGIGETGSLTATPSGGTPGWNFVWSRFTVGSSGWALYTTQNNVPTSTISNLPPGAYSVTITDGNGVVVGCDIAWVSQIQVEGEVDVAPIPPNCSGPVILDGTITFGSVTPYSNLPATQMLIDANTQISVCFNGTHTWVSDLAFYMVGPASCGSPTLLLMPNPGAIGQGAVCNSGNNISNFCFSTESNNNINVCSPAPATLSGTYGTYGLANTPVNWSTIYGCDASTAGWSVQIYDCIGGDVGALTGANITFNGVNSCGQPQTVSYATPGGYSSTISDNTCSASTASIFTVPPANPTPPIVCDYGYEWNSEPYVYIADSTTSLNIQLDELTDASGNVIPWQSVVFSLSITSDCDTVADPICFGGDGYDEELFDLLPTGTVVIDPVQTLCTSSPTQTLVTNIPGGTWYGTGIIDAVNGVFDPSITGVGSFLIDYIVDNPCIVPGSITIDVEAVPVLNLVAPAGLCVDANSIDLEDLSPNNGTYSGTGITHPSQGTFDPGVAGVGQHTITVDIGGICPNSASGIIEVYALPIINAGPDADVCPFAGHPLTANGAGAGSYSWSPGTGLNNSNIFNPVATIQGNTTYTVTGTDVNGCSSTDAVSLTLLPMPEVDVTAVAMICPGESVDLVASGSVGTYAWTPAAGLSNPNSEVATASPMVTTTYTISVTDDCDITATATLTVPVEEIYVVSAGPNMSYCEGENVYLVGEVSGSNPSIEWSSANGTVPANSGTSSILVDTPGDYQIHVTTPLGCSYDDLTHVNEIPLPVLSIAEEVNLCPAGSVELHAGNNWDAVAWSNGQYTADITVFQPGTYHLTVTENGCQSSGSITVNLVMLPYLELGPDVMICQGETISFNSPVDGNWSNGDNDDQINVSAAGTYSVVIYELGCSVEDSVHVFVHPLPFVELGPPIVGCIDQPVPISAYHEDNDTYIWNTGETGDLISVLDADLYYVTVSNECGTMSDFVDVSFMDCTYSIYIPNSFTPDNDGINDVWKISTFNVTKISLNIINRWGEVVFHSEDPQTVWTGGKDDGDHYVNDGVYIYHLKFETELKETGERTGTIVVVR